jgi:prevent-host-death family protein
MVYNSVMTMRAEIGTGQLADLVKEVEAGNEVVLTQGNKPVARLVAASGKFDSPATVLSLRSLKCHRVLSPSISQSDLAEELFG